MTKFLSRILGAVPCLGAKMRGAAHAPQHEKKTQQTITDGGGPAREKNLVRGREQKAANAAFELGFRDGRAGRYNDAFGRLP